MKDERNDKLTSPAKGIGRREVLKGAVKGAAGLSLGLAFADVFDLAAAQQAQETDPKKMPPQEGDWFVFSQGSNKGQLVSTDDIPSSGPQVIAWPAEVTVKNGQPQVKLVRDGNSQNKVLLMRFPEDKYGDKTQKYTTSKGVVAYAATCTHQCCIVTGWEAKPELLHCPCHGSEYDPLHFAHVQPGSPAPRPLPILKLKTTGQDKSFPAVAADGFRTQVGCGPIRR